MMRRMTLLTGVAALMLHGASAKAAETRTKQVDIEANQMEILDGDKKAIFKGQVNARRGDTVLTADELIVLYDEVKQPDGTTKTDATSMDARGAVTIKTPKETITGDWAKLNPQTNQLVVGGKVKLVQGATILTGPELRADLDTDRVQMSGGRVKGSFLPR